VQSLPGFNCYLNAVTSLQYPLSFLFLIWDVSSSTLNDQLKSFNPTAIRVSNDLVLDVLVYPGILFVLEVKGTDLWHAI